MSGEEFTDTVTFLAEGYEYGVQHFSTHYNEWRMTSTNHFHGWYPTKKSAKNALVQLRTARYGYRSNLEYRLIRRPYGEVEVVEG